MKWLTKNKNRIFIFFILILFVNLNIKAETEAERRASIRYFQEHLDREEKKTQQEADRIYDEKYGPGKTNSSNGSNIFAIFILIPVVIIFLGYSIIEMSQNTNLSREVWPKNRNWNPKYGSKADYEKIIYKGNSPSYNDQSEKWYLRFLKGGNRIKPMFRAESTEDEDTGEPDRYTWESFTYYKKIFFQNKNRITGKLDIKEYYRLVVEYNLCSSTERRLEIGAVFAERKWGEPFLKQLKREPFKSEKAESNRKTIEQKRLLFLPCPECLTDIDCNDAQEDVVYSCHRCSICYRLRKDVGLIES